MCGGRPLRCRSPEAADRRRGRAVIDRKLHPGPSGVAAVCVLLGWWGTREKKYERTGTVVIRYYVVWRKYENYFELVENVFYGHGPVQLQYY
jgi:hypothetical protein